MPDNDILAAILNPQRASVDDFATKVLNQVNCPLLLILSLSVLVAAMNTRAIDDTQRILTRGAEAGDETPPIIEALKQKLIRNIDVVCAREAQAMHLGLFPTADRVRMEAGFPDDQAFRALCREARERLERVDDRVLALYAAALRHLEPGENPNHMIYDLVQFPDSADANAASPFVITPDGQGQKLRTYAQQRIRDYFLRWRDHVRGLQVDIVEATLDAPQAQAELVAADRAQMKQRIRDVFSSRGMPLLSDSL